jgi:DNA topoisomerase I
MKNLVIVESPTKARTIGKFLGSDYVIKASMGHLMDLPKSKIGIDFEHDFNPLYELVADKRQIIADLKTSAKKADQIILATDPDREGEAIASHVAQMLGDKKGEFKRIVFHEITKEAIEEALKIPRMIDKHLVDAQTARRVLDRLVGYKLSPLLWKKVRRGLSAGRVQSIALRLIVEREREIEKFGKEKYWTISALLSRQPKENSTEFELIEINNEKIEIAKVFNLYDGQYKITKTSIDSEEKALQIVNDLKTKTFTVSDVLMKEAEESCASLYNFDSSTRCLKKAPHEWKKNHESGSKTL